MAIETERKFLVNRQIWRSPDSGVAYRQGYICALAGRTVRVRVAGDQGFLTIKGPSVGISRSEFEYAVPLADALEMLETLCPPPWIEKVRYSIRYAGLVWEVDEFSGENQGLLIAEVELSDLAQAIDLPDWVGAEVSDDPRYYNSNLAHWPFTRW